MRFFEYVIEVYEDGEKITYHGLFAATDYIEAMRVALDCFDDHDGNIINIKLEEMNDEPYLILNEDTIKKIKEQIF